MLRLTGHLLLGALAISAGQVMPPKVAPTLTESLAPMTTGASLICSSGVDMAARNTALGKRSAAGANFLAETLGKGGLPPVNLEVNCSLGRTCPDNNKCCVVGISFWCCPNPQSCDYDNYACKNP
jgi:hypothetical protein